MRGGYPLDSQGWPKTPEEVRAWYASAERWMNDRGKRSLSALGHRLWEIAAAGETIEYLPLAREFGLNHRGPRSVATFAGILSEYCEKVLGHVFLSSVIVRAGTRREPHPRGLPGPGGWWDGAPSSDSERIRWALERQATVWRYCSTHQNPFSA